MSILCLCDTYSLDSQIKDSVREVGSLLAKVSGTGQVSLSQPAQRNIIQQESDTVLQPLMDFLDGSLTMFAQVCEKTILKRLLKVCQLNYIDSCLLPATSHCFVILILRVVTIGIMMMLVVMMMMITTVMVIFHIKCELNYTLYKLALYYYYYYYYCYYAQSCRPGN